VGGTGPHYDTDPVWFDPKNDVALLRAPALTGTPALRLNSDAREGTSAAILGFPENGPYDVEPGRLGNTQTVVSDDAYGHGPVRRSITALRGLVRQGNSGGPMVDGSGRVVTTIFAATVSGGHSGFGVPDSIVRDALARARGTVDTGPCAR
jgi:S1-C subfamily serine protease